MHALPYSLAPVCAAIGAALIAVSLRPGSRFRSVTQHLAAGVILGAVCLELIPDTVKRQAVLATAIGFCSAVLGLLLLRRYAAASTENRPELKVPRTYLTATAIDLFVDGLVIAIGFSVGTKQGRLLALALALELLSLGFALTTELLERRIARGRAVVITALVSGFVIAGAAFGAVVLPYTPATFLSGSLGFGIAAVLFLVTEELLREAHELEDTATATAILFGGFLVIYILSTIQS